MRLRRLALFGFKSFADRTVFEFGDDTLTGIVGPNGCGKSNVVDAARWVLGEQRPTSMRGAEMTDVIFKGSTSRPALSVAEVTLTLDNTQGTLEGRGNEVEITRRVFKDGAGEYLIDGQVVRLKDVREMLFDTGLGSRGYSVLEQGKIDAVLSANPLERRRVFEEAAGISRYRQRKVEAELRLKRVADDMARLDDVIAELSSRVRSLKIQAGKAERFVEARAEWARERTRYFKHRSWSSGRELAQWTAELSRLERDGGEQREARSRAEAEVASLAREGSTLVAEVDRLAQESALLAGDGRAFDERRVQLKNRIAAAEKSAEDETVRTGELAAALAERDAERESVRAALDALGGETRRAQAALASERQAARALEQRYRDERARSARQNETVLALLHQKSQIENRIQSLGESQKPAADRRARLEEKLALARGVLDAQRDGEAELAERVTRETEAHSTEDRRQKEREAKLAASAAELERIESERTELELERARVHSRIEFLLDRERDLEQLSSGARRAAEEVGRGSFSCAADELLGWVADHLRTETRYARALDAVLGERAQALVARDGDAALKVSSWLKEHGAGQLWLVLAAPLSDHEGEVTAIELSADENEGVTERSGIIGRLREHVRCTKGLEPLADLLCGDVFVVADLERGLALCARHPRARCVTLEGEFVHGPSLWSGSRSVTQGAVGRRSSAAELEAQLSTLAQAIAELGGRIEARTAERAALAAEIERAAIDLEARRQACAEAEAQLTSARTRLGDLESSVHSLESECGVTGRELSEMERELVAAQTDHARLAARYQLESETLSALEASTHALEIERDEATRTVARSEVETARAEAELAGLERRLSDLARVCTENRAEVERVRRLAEEQRREAQRGAVECEELAEKSAQVLARRGDLEARLTVLRERLESGRASTDSGRRRVEDLTRELEDTQARIATVRLDVQRIELARAEVTRRAMEELGLSEDDLGRDFEAEDELSTPEALDALDVAVRDLKARLEKLGPVNMEAMGELAEVGARLDFLTAQRKDLAESRDALNETVSTIDAESKRLFLESFETVRANFQKIFRQLFGGGRADVLLEEGVDPLDAGVEIVARPPGRELLSIGLLSGGQRTLTALALLFAVFESRPSPFCILDEVDAALDDANVDRFLAMIDGFRKHSQFVVVTHNKGTMAACQSLYGVTMETKGVSRHVSVELSDVDRWTGAARASTDREVPPAAVPAKPSAAEDAADHSSETYDRDTGEPVVEIVPLSRDPAGDDRPPRRVTRRARSSVPVTESNGSATEQPSRAESQSGAESRSNGGMHASTTAEPSQGAPSS